MARGLEQAKLLEERLDAVKEAGLISQRRGVKDAIEGGYGCFLTNFHTSAQMWARLGSNYTATSLAVPLTSTPGKSPALRPDGREEEKATGRVVLTAIPTPAMTTIVVQTVRVPEPAVARIPTNLTKDVVDTVDAARPGPYARVVVTAVAIVLLIASTMGVVLARRGYRR